MPAGQCTCWGAGCARCVRLSHDWQQTRADWSDNDESDSDGEAYTQRFIPNVSAHAAAYHGTCAACRGAGCGQCVRLSCGWENMMHVHLVAATRAVRSPCQCWGAGWCERCTHRGGSRSAPPATSTPAEATSRPAEAALAVLADCDDASDAVDEEEQTVMSVSSCGAAGSCQLSGTSEVLRLPNDEENELYSQGGHAHDDSVDALAGCFVARPRHQQADGRCN